MRYSFFIPGITAAYTGSSEGTSATISSSLDGTMPLKHEKMFCIPEVNKSNIGSPVVVVSAINTNIPNAITTTHTNNRTKISVDIPEVYIIEPAHEVGRPHTNINIATNIPITSAATPINVTIIIPIKLTHNTTIINNPVYIIDIKHVPKQPNIIISEGTHMLAKDNDIHNELRQ